MQNLRYVGKNLFLERVSIRNFLKKNKTPFYIYSENQIVANYSNFVKTFKKTNPLICFAAKSNSNKNILRILGKLGSGADVVSGGELLKALRAGIKPKKIVFSGVGKSEEELKIAINKKILLINCESESEAILVNALGKKLRKKVSIGFRLNPNVDAKTHKNISTGKADNKFGLSIKNFKSFFKEINKYKHIKLEALSVHIGSQILNDGPFKKTLNVMNKLIKELKGKKDGCTYGMGGSLSIHSPKINMYGHDGFMGSNACIGTGACFSSKKPTIIFIGDAALEEDYVLASLSWVSKKKLPILFVVDDNNFAVLTKKDERRDWAAKDLAKAFKLQSFDIKDDPKKILRCLYKDLFKKPTLINIHTQRLFWHAGAGKDNENVFDRHLQQKKFLGKKADLLDTNIKKRIELLWEKN